MGVGAILFQVHNGKLCVPSFLHADRNDTIRDWEFLATKLALQEWQHLLEGSPHHTQFYTNHKNLQYLQSAWCLNPRQAQLALFFNSFNFDTTYWPGSKNGHADALSRSFDVADSECHVEPEPIIPASHILSTT